MTFFSFIDVKTSKGDALIIDNSERRSCQ